MTALDLAPARTVTAWGLRSGGGLAIAHARLVRPAAQSSLELQGQVFLFLPPRLPESGDGAAYLGFFNHEVQGWRAWNSMALRLSAGRLKGHAIIGADAMTALWHAAGGSEGFVGVPADGQPHTVRFTYDPQATPGEFPEPRLKNYLTSGRQTVDDMLPRARQDEPNITREELYERLVAAHSAGLVSYLDRRGPHAGRRTIGRSSTGSRC